MLLIIAAVLFVVGVGLEALAHNGVGAPNNWTDRAAWVLWTVAAIIGLVIVIAGAHGAA